MKIMERYIFREFVKSLFYCITAFISLYIIADFFTYIDEMMKYHVPVKTIAIYYMAFAPTIFVQVAPMAALLATIYTLSRLKRHNEITAMRVSGISLWKILMPLIFTVSLLGFSIFAVDDRLVPELMPLAERIKKEKIKGEGRKKRKALIENIAIFGENNRINEIKSFDTEDKSLNDIIIHENDQEHNLIMKLSAQKGYYQDDRWTFENGTSYRLDKTGYIIGTPTPFRKKIMELEETPKDFIQRGKHPKFMNFRQLKLYISRFAAKGSSTTKKLLVDLYYKTSLPFISLALIFVAAPFAFRLQRGGLMIGLGTSILVGLAFYSVQAISLAMGKGGLLPPLVSAWLPIIGFFAAGLHLMKKCR